MNKKGFYKRFLYLPIPKQYLDKLWQWIEQYGKEQRIDERQSIIKLIKRIKADKPSIGAKEALRTVLIELGEE